MASNREHTSVSKNNFLKIIEFIFENTYFNFNKKIYNQVFETPIESPINPIIAEIILEYLLTKVHPKLPIQYAILI